MSNSDTPQVTVIPLRAIHVILKKIGWAIGSGLCWLLGLVLIIGSASTILLVPFGLAIAARNLRVGAVAEISITLITGVIWIAYVLPIIAPRMIVAAAALQNNAVRPSF